MTSRHSRVALGASLMLAPLSTLAAQEVLHTVQKAPGYASSVACAGDVDGDGKQDLAIGDAFGGSVEILSGDDFSVLLTIPIVAIPPSFGNLPSYAIDGVGDVNGDGRSDILIASVGPAIVGPAGYVPAGPGSAAIYSGQDGSVLHTLASNNNDHSFGFAGAGIDDLDGDGVAEIVVGAPFATAGGKSGAGYVRVFSGQTGGLIFQVDGSGFNDRFGQSISAAGDQNQDGVPDFLVSSLASSGTAHVVSGSDGSLIRALTAGSLFTSPSFGLGYADVEVAGGEDVDADGFDDIVLGKRGDLTGGFNAGAVFVFSGADSSLLHTFVGNPCDGIGAATELGDVNDDGYADVIWGQRNDLGLTDKVDVRSGLTGELIFTTQTMIQDMAEVAIAGDVDGDGSIDLVCGTDPYGANAGLAAVIGGGPSLGDGAKGSVESLKVNGEIGGQVRRVDLGVSGALSITLDQPATNGSPANFVLFGSIGVPLETEVHSLGSIGDTTILPAPLGAGVPTLFTLASSFPGLGELVTASPGAFSFDLPVGVGQPITFTLQAVVEVTPGELKTTNAIAIRID